jgi:hypothetical protein
VDGTDLAMLHNSGGERGVSIGFLIGKLSMVPKLCSGIVAVDLVV